MQRLLLLFLLLMPVAVGAASYSWTDANGTLHFTDDLGSVPKQHRKKALQRAAGDDAAAAAPVENSGKPPAANVSPKEAQPALQAAPVPAPTAQVTPATRFGDRSAAEWQAQFKAMRAELASIDQQRAALRQESGEGKVMLSSQKIAELNVRNKKLNEEYEALRLRFNQLVEQANKVGLPPEFGQ